MTPDERRVVAENCFAFSGKATEAEGLAGGLLQAQAIEDNTRIEQHLRTMHGGNSWRAGMASRNAGCMQKVVQPYDAALIAVVDDWARTGDVEAAYLAKHPTTPAPPSNFSQALRRLWSGGFIARKNDAKPFDRNFLWGSLEMTEQ